MAASNLKGDGEFSNSGTGTTSGTPTAGITVTPAMLRALTEATGGAHGKSFPPGARRAPRTLSRVHRLSSDGAVRTDRVPPSSSTRPTCVSYKRTRCNSKWISVIAFRFRAPYRNGMMRRRGAPCSGGIGSSFMSHASITWGCMSVATASST